MSFPKVKSLVFLLLFKISKFMPSTQLDGPSIELSEGMWAGVGLSGL